MASLCQNFSMRLFCFVFGSVVADALHFTRFIENTKKDNGVSKAILMKCNNNFQMIAMSFTKEVTWMQKPNTIAWD